LANVRGLGCVTGCTRNAQLASSAALLGAPTADMAIAKTATPVRTVAHRRMEILVDFIVLNSRL